MSLIEKETLTKTVKKDMVLIGLLLAACIVLMFVNFWYTTVKDRQDKQYIAISGELRILSQSIAKHASNAADGIQDAFTLLHKRRDDFDEGLLILKNGDEKLKLPASSFMIRQNELMSLENTWKITKDKVDTILGRQDLLLNHHDVANQLNEMLPKIQKQYDTVVQILLDDKASPRQIILASEQSVLAQKLLQKVDKVVQNNTDVLKAAESFSEESSMFQKRLKAMIGGDPSLGIEKVEDSRAIEVLKQMEEQYIEIQANVDKIVKTSKEFAMVNGAAFDIYISSQTLLEQATTLSRAYNMASEMRFIGEPVE